MMRCFAGVRVGLDIVHQVMQTWLLPASIFAAELARAVPVRRKRRLLRRGVVRSQSTTGKTMYGLSMNMTASPALALAKNFNNLLITTWGEVKASLMP